MLLIYRITNELKKYLMNANLYLNLGEVRQKKQGGLSGLRYLSSLKVLELFNTKTI
jgi:hypothetical protein